MSHSVCVLTVPSNPGRVGSADDTGCVGEATVCSWPRRGGSPGLRGAAVPVALFSPSSVRSACPTEGARAQAEAPKPSSQGQVASGQPWGAATFLRRLGGVARRS